METVSYQLTVADLTDARGYVYNRLPFVRAIRLVPLILILGCLLLGAYRAVHGDWRGVADLGGWFFIGLALIAWTRFGNRWLLPHSARKQLARSKSLHGDQIVSWDAERIMFESSHGQSRWPWSDLYRWQESSGGLLLWISDRTYFYLPKRVLADSRLSGIRANLITAMGGPGKRRK